MKRLVLLFVALLAVAACQKTTAPPPSASDADASVDAKPKVEAGVTKPELPAFDDRCSTDADCGAIHVHTVGPDTCCSLGCGIGKGNKAWIDAVEAACKKTPHPECKDIQCDGPAPPFKPKCKDGRCTLTY